MTGRAENLTTNPYLNGVLFNTHQVEDMVYAIGLQESMAIANSAGGMGGPPAFDPNLAFLQNNVMPHVNQATSIFNQAMGRSQIG